MVLDLRVGDVVRLRRKHPCGGRDWDVVRVGAVVGLRCRSCDSRVLMDRPTLRLRAERLEQRGPALAPDIEAAIKGGAGPSGPPPALR